MEKEEKLLLIAVAVAATGFTVTAYFGMLWLALFIAAFSGFAYIGWLLTRSKQHIQSDTAYKVVTGVGIILILFSAFGVFYDYSRRDFQKDLLMDIRKTIGEGGMKAEVGKELLYAFSRYKSSDFKSVTEAANSVLKENLGEDGRFYSEAALRYPEDRHEMIEYKYVLDEERDELTVIGVERVARGEDPGYTNSDGRLGFYEMKFVLNQEGVSYEVLN